MLKRTLFFSSPGRLFLENTLLTYEPESRGETPEKHHFPVEDIGFMVLESQQITVTTACLNMLAQANVAVIVCDDSHMPVAAFQPYAGNSLTQRTTAAQLEASEALKGRLWRQTVAAKITNQAQCLARFGLPEARLRVLAGSVQNADPENVEGVAARVYFQLLAGEGDFTRGREGIPPNHALNYGYAILRAAVARALIGSGLLCVAGIHHANQYNPFGLADDVMEPYRPFVDEIVFSDRDFFAVPELGKAQKAKLLGVLACDVLIGAERRPLMNALSYTTASLVRCFRKEEKQIRYPEFPG